MEWKSQQGILTIRSMRRRITVVIPMFVVLSACGGGSAQGDGIAGVWKGDLLQGPIICSNGAATGVGSSSVWKSVALEVAGGDQIGDTVFVTDGTCVFEGERNKDGFVADVVSGCDIGLKRLLFELLADGRAGVGYVFDIDKVPPGANGVRCMATPSGNLQR